MKSIEWSFYDAATGLLAPANSMLPEGVDPLGFAPPGCLPYAGRLDPRTQRVDVSTKQPVAYRPPTQAEDELRLIQRQREAALRHQIAEHEAAQARPMREVLMALASGQQPPQAAVRRLAAIEQAVAPLRQQITEP